MTGYQLDKTPIHIGPGTGATPVEGFADVIEPFSAVYLTPCPGTKHRPRS